MGVLVFPALAALLLAIVTIAGKRSSATKKKKLQTKHKPVAKDLHKEDDKGDAAHPKLDAHGQPVVETTAAGTTPADPHAKPPGDAAGHGHPPPKTLKQKMKDDLFLWGWYLMLGIIVIGCLWLIKWGYRRLTDTPKENHTYQTVQVSKSVAREDDRKPVIVHKRLTGPVVVDNDDRHTFVWHVEADKDSVLIDQTWYEDDPSKNFDVKGPHHFEFRPCPNVPAVLSYTITPN